MNAATPLSFRAGADKPPYVAPVSATLSQRYGRTAAPAEPANTARIPAPAIVRSCIFIPSLRREPPDTSNEHNGSENRGSSELGRIFGQAWMDRGRSGDITPLRPIIRVMLSWTWGTQNPS